MKRTSIITCLLTIGMISFSIAQTIEEVASVAAKGLCGCVNESYSNIDSDVKRAMVRIFKYQMEGKQAEVERYASSLSADLASRIEEQAGLFQENDDLFQLCIEDMELAMAKMNLDEGKYENVSEETMINLMLKEMHEMKGCKFAYLLMELGLQEQMNENQNNTGQIKGQSTSGNQQSDSKKYEGTGGN